MLNFLDFNFLPQYLTGRILTLDCFSTMYHFYTCSQTAAFQGNPGQMCNTVNHDHHWQLIILIHFYCHPFYLLESLFQTNSEFWTLLSLLISLRSGAYFTEKRKAIRQNLHQHLNFELRNLSIFEHIFFIFPLSILTFP